jgi:hypothetical protein
MIVAFVVETTQLVLTVVVFLTETDLPVTELVVHVTTIYLV